MQHGAHAIVAKAMGYDATWNDVTARVLFNDPSSKYQLAGIEFEPAGWSMEYQNGDFPGLYELVHGGEVPQVTIDTTAYYIRSIRKDFDGKTYKAQLTPVE